MLAPARNRRVGFCSLTCLNSSRSKNIYPIDRPVAPDFPGKVQARHSRYWAYWILVLIDLRNKRSKPPLNGEKTQGQSGRTHRNVCCQRCPTVRNCAPQKSRTGSSGILTKMQGIAFLVYPKSCCKGKCSQLH